MDYGEKNILVLGAGSSGIGAAWVLAQLHANVVLNDYKPVEFESSTRKKLDDAGVTIITGRQDNSLLNGVDRIVISPGIALSIPIVQEAFNRHIEVVSEVELAYDVCKSPILGVTGTNGKTTTTTLLTQVMESTGLPIKVGGNIGDSLSEAAFNMPEGGYLIAELSSYQLETIKSFCPLGAIVLNVTPDHLARHKTMENYAHAKSLLFSQLGNHSKNEKPRVAILNRDQEYFEQFAYSTSAEIISYGFTEEADIRATEIESNGAMTTFVVTVNGERFPVMIPMIGLFNVYNVLAAFGVAMVNGISLRKAIEKIAKFPGVGGRMQLIQKGQPFQVIIDFAHTPDGLENVLSTLEEVKINRVITIMGHSGGNRDSSMRPELGEIAFEKSDYVILTADNPRQESLEKIYSEIVSGRKNENTPYECVDDRKQAIERALELAQEGDILLFAGKGVEPYQVIGEEYIPYNEVETVVQALEKLGYNN